MGSVCFILLFVVSLVEVITGYYLMLYTIFDRKKMNRCYKGILNCFPSSRQSKK